MKKMLLPVALFLSSVSFAQQEDHLLQEANRNHMEHATLAPGSAPIIFQNSNDHTGLFRDASTIATSYRIIFHLSDVQEASLQNGLSNFIRTNGSIPLQTHQYVGGQLKQMLSASDYLRWLQMKSYPEQ